MALVLFGGGIVAARGKVGGTVFSRAKSGGVMKSRTTCVNPRTAQQTIARAIMATSSNDWSNNTSQADQATWTALALINPVTNVFGQTLYLSGQQLFCQINCNLATAGLSRISAAPADLNVNPFTSASIAASSAGPGSLIATLGIPATIGTPLTYFYMSPPQNPGVNFVSSRLRCFGSFGAPSSPFDVTGLYQTKFGSTSLVAGKKIFGLFAIINSDNGAVSAGIMCSCIIS